MLGPNNFKTVDMKPNNAKDVDMGDLRFKAVNVKADIVTRLLTACEIKQDY